MPFEPVALSAISYIAGKVIDTLLRGVTKIGAPKRALERALGRSLGNLRIKHPKIHALLLEDDLLWDAMREEVDGLLSPDHQPDAKRLAARVRGRDTAPPNRLDEALEELFKLIRTEASLEPDLFRLEAVRRHNDVQSRLDQILEVLGVEVDIERVTETARAAANAHISGFMRGEAWPENPELLSLVLLPADESGELVLIDIAGVSSLVDTGCPITVVADPGAGKTTTLIQLAGHMLESTDGVVPVFVPLSRWVVHGGDLFEYLAARSAFVARVKADHIRLLGMYGRIVFLFDGWNELAGESLNKVRVMLVELCQDYPCVGVVVATRSHVQSPNLPGARNVEIHSLTEEQRAHIVRETLADGAEALLDHIGRHRELDEITRVPLYLSGLLALAGEAPLPNTKQELLGAFIDKHERNEDHAAPLRDALKECHVRYLQDLAVEMIHSGNTALRWDDARRSVTATGEALVGEGLIGSQPEPRDALAALAGHHLLLRFGADGEEAYAFQHHQFQEWFASWYVARLIRAAVQEDGKETKRQLCMEVIDDRHWEEAVLFAVERLSREGDEAATAVAKVIVWTLGIDPMFAAAMIWRTGEDVWGRARDQVVDFAHSWHRDGQVDRGLGFMIATGRSEFADIVWPMVGHADQQIRLRSLRIADPFRPSVLGANWRERFGDFPEEIRRYIAAEMAYHGATEGLDRAAEIARTDPSVDVRLRALEGLNIRCAAGRIQAVLNDASEDFWTFLAGSGKFETPLDEAHRNRLIEIKLGLLHEMTPGPTRTRFLLDLDKMGCDEVRPLIFVELEADDLESDSDGTFALIHRAWEINPQSTSDAILRRLLSGKEVKRHWREFVGEAKPEYQRQLADVLMAGEERLSDGEELAAHLIGPEEVRRLIERLLELSDEIASAPRPVPESLRNAEWRMKDLLKHTRLSVRARAIVDLPPVEQASHAAELATVLNQDDREDERENSRLLVPKELMDELQKVIFGWIEVVMASTELRRGRMATIAILIGRLGRQADIHVLKELLDLEITRWKEDNTEFLEWIGGGRRGPQPSESRMSYFNQYQMDFAALSSPEVPDVMMGYVDVPEFCVEAASVLRLIARREGGAKPPRAGVPICQTSQK